MNEIAPIIGRFLSGSLLNPEKMTYSFTGKADWYEIRLPLAALDRDGQNYIRSVENSLINLKTDTKWLRS